MALVVFFFMFRHVGTMPPYSRKLCSKKLFAASNRAVFRDPPDLPIPRARSSVVESLSVDVRFGGMSSCGHVFARKPSVHASEPIFWCFHWKGEHWDVIAVSSPRCICVASEEAILGHDDRLFQ